MPYRRLPNTDAARVKALQTAIDKCKNMPSNECALTYEIILKAKFFLPSLQSGIRQRRSFYSQSVEKGANFYHLQKRTKMYISHFIQVLNMAIARDEFKSSARDYYGLTKKKLPSLETTEEIIEWGKKLIEGENLRISEGGTPMSNPRISLLKIEYDKFVAASRNNEFRLMSDKRSADYIEDLRKRGDELITEIWNAVEDFYKNLPAEERRKICAEYGVSYVWRKSELQHSGTEFDSEQAENSTEQQ